MRELRRCLGAPLRAWHPAARPTVGVLQQHRAWPVQPFMGAAVTLCGAWSSSQASPASPAPLPTIPCCCCAHRHQATHAWLHHPWRPHHQHQWRGHQQLCGAPRAGVELSASPEDGLGHVKRRVEASKSRLQSLTNVIDLPAAKSKLALLEQEAGQGELWQDPDKAQALLSQISHLRNEVESVVKLNSQLEEAAFAVELLESSPDMESGEAAEVMREAMSTLDTLDTSLNAWELQRLLGGPFDERDARLLITAGAGGADAMDWAEMLERMYLRWAEARAFSVKVVDRSVGEEAGIKSVELEVVGRYAYGYLRSEKGTHRLVRSSPFNAKGLRQTSFAGVEVLPILNETQDLLDIKESELQFSFSRSGGAGGQNVNKVETAVRVTHLATGITVKCTQERTQLANRAIAMDMLRAKLLVVMQEQRAAQVAEIRGDQVKAEWGQQIRNYVLHPYKMVKCTRTGYETTDAASVLDGDLEPFISAYLRQRGRLETAAALAEQ